MLSAALRRSIASQAGKEELKKTFAALVVNEPGVLSRISGFFSSRGFNIDSLVVGTTHLPGLSRMTIVSSGTRGKLDQLRRQMEAMVQVREVVELGADHAAITDLALVKVSTKTPGSRSAVVEIANLFRAEVLDVSNDELLIKIAEHPNKIDSFVGLMDKYGVTEMGRTGVVALANCGAPGKISPPAKLPTQITGTSTINEADLPPS